MPKQPEPQPVPDEKQHQRKKIEHPIDMEYPTDEDIYHRSKLEPDTDPENTSQTKTPNQDDAEGENNEKDFDDDKSGSDLRAIASKFLEKHWSIV